MCRRSPIAFLTVLGLAAATPAVRDNYVEFSGADTIQWTETLHSIADGQPYDGVSTFGTSIRIKAGRQGGSKPAADFLEGLGFEEHVLGLGAVAQKPAELNFATFGSLSATFPSGDTRTCDGLRLGQGHTGGKNNWWVASEKCVQTKSDGFVCEACGLSFFPAGDHTFKVREIEVDTGIDNLIKFDGANRVEWKEESHSISSGQPYEGVECQGDSSGLPHVSCDIRAGRKGSPSAAADFLDGLDLANVIAIGGGTARRLLATAAPRQLNFATFGTLTADFPLGHTRTCEGMRIGGDGATGEDWWIGGKNCVNTGRQLSCAQACGVTFAPDIDGQIKIGLVTPDSAAISASGLPYDPTLDDPAVPWQTADSKDFKAGCSFCFG